MTDLDRSIAVHCSTGHDYPDAGKGACCMGAAGRGPAHCTCWEPEYDMAQLPPVTRPVGLRTEPCGDCAYRGDSPERRGDPHVRGDEDFLDAIVQKGTPFFCHVGTRRVVRYVHGPTGKVYIPPRLDAAYQPPQDGHCPYKADGTPADLCAGWALRRLALGRSARGTKAGG